MAIFFIAIMAQSQETKYTSNSFARLSFISGNTYIQRAADLGYEEGQVNMPITEGDRIGTTDGRAEIYIGNKNYVRLDKNTKVDFLNLPKKDAGLVRVRHWAGNIYLDIDSLEKEKAVEVLTADATFYVLDKGLYRINVKENKETEILVFSGMVEASGEEGSMLVKKEECVTVSEGRFPSRPASFFASADDSFDRWNGTRNSQIRKQFARRYLSGELEDFEYELNEYGDWMYMPEFGYVWAPRGMASDWRPYYYGRWMWLPLAGWCWIPYEPWGWSTFHYGRWHWAFGIGWYWIPMNVWGPAWVNWWWGYDYFAWAPMSYWGYPGIIIDNFYYGRGWFNYHEYPYNSRALTVIHKNQLQSPVIHKAALGPDAIRSVGKMDLSEKGLNFKPLSGSKVSVEQLEGGKKVILRKGGEGGELEPSRRPEKSTVTGKEVQGPKSGDQKNTAGQRRIEPKTAEPGTVEPRKKGDTASSNNPPPGTERKIRKKKDGETGAGENEAQMNSFPRRADSFGYPSRDVNRQSSLIRRSTSGSVMDRFYKFFSGGSSSFSRGSLGRGTISGGSVFRSMPRSFSSPPSSRGAGGSSGSRPGTIRKK